MAALAPLFGADSMLFIYHFEGNPVFGPAAGRVLSAVEKGQLRLVVSSLVLLEILVVPKRHGDERLCQRYRDFFQTFPSLKVQPVDIGIAEIASELRAAYSLRTPDATHLATGLATGAQAFLTEDARLRSLPKLEVRRFEEAFEAMPKPLANVERGGS
jgi:predicted nucleic acid-binding protein